ncbi:uncharacterized protein LOC135367011 [Ornithodoros turicata]|uniref:uncharacterized protein LOC135367011 n=1 Tax=Ornithodoros turicata TaxID=34597 RepID=UPI0031394401
MHPHRKEEIRNVAVLLVKTLECPICLDILDDPLATKCHHRFCRLCIEKALVGKYKIPCPLCNAIVTKRSLNKSENIAEIVQKVRKLSDAIREDTGLDVTPPRGPRTSIRSPEGHSLEIFNMLHPSPLKTTRNQPMGRSVTRNEAPKRKRRAASVSSNGSTAKPSKQKRVMQDKQCDRSTGVNTPNQPEVPANPSQPASSAARNECDDEVSDCSMPKPSHQVAEHCEHAEEDVELCDVVSCTNTVSSCSTNHLMVRQGNSVKDVVEATPEKECCEDPIPFAPSAANEKKDYSRRGIATPTHVVSTSEKVSTWLLDHEDNASKSPTEVTAHMDATEHNSPVNNKRRSKFFSVKPLAKRGSPGGRKKFLDVSDSDPYKFIPSQKALQSKGRRCRRGKGAKKSSASKASLRSNKLGCTSKIIEEAELEFLKGGPENATRKRVVADPSELEVELFVTPAFTVEPTEETNECSRRIKKKRSILSLRRTKKLGSVSEEKKKKAEREAEMLRNKITEAEGFELSISKTPPRKQRGLSERDGGVALKDVSNLRAKPTQNTLSQFIISPRRRPHTGTNTEAQTIINENSPGKLSETVTSMRKGANPIPETATVDSSSQEEALHDVDPVHTIQVVLDEDEQLQGDLPLPQPVDRHLDQQCKDSDIHVNRDNVARADGEDSEVVVLGETPAPCISDMTSVFKKPSRKTFDINAETEDMQPLAATAVNTLELMNDICDDYQESAEQSINVHYKRAMKQHAATSNVVATDVHHSKCSGGSDKDMPVGGARKDYVSTTKTPESTTTGVVERADQSTSMSQMLTRSTSCCPNCNVTLVVTFADGEVTVSSTHVPQKPLLVDKGMCTERPGTRVIICKEAVTQTEEWDVRINTQHGGLETQGSASEVHLAKQTAHSMASRCDEHISPDMRDSRSIPQESTDCSMAMTLPKSSGIPTSGIGEERNPGEVPDKIELRPEATGAHEGTVSHRDSRAFIETESDVHILESEILCKATQDQADAVRDVGRKDLSAHLTPVVEETQEHSSCQASTTSIRGGVEIDDNDKCKEKGADTHMSSDLLNVINSSRERVPSQSLQENREEDLNPCDVSAASDLPDVCNYINEESDGKEVTMGACSATQLPFKSAEPLCSPCDTLKTSGGYQVLQGETENEENSPCTPVREEPVNKNISLSSSRGASPRVPTLPAAALPVVERTPEKRISDTGQSSGDSSPDWSPPITVSKTRTQLTRSLFDVNQQENDGEANKQKRATLDVSRNDSLEQEEPAASKIQSSAGDKKSKRAIVEITDSESNSSLSMDPITESEANELLQCALLHDEDSPPDEAAMSFARNAVAPLKNSTSQDTWMKKNTSRKSYSRLEPSPKPSRRGSLSSTCLPEPTRSTGMRTRRGSRKSQPLRAESSVAEGFAGEFESHPLTTCSSISCLEDRTLKEKLLEQDIEEMKKQMLMLENELKQAAMDTDEVTDVPGDSGNQKRANHEKGEKSLGDRAKMTKAQDDFVLEDDFMESDEELLDAVPPTPPRKGVPRKQHSFRKDKRW